MPFLGGDPGVSAGRVNKGNNWQAELVGETHQAKGLAIAFGMGGAEIAEDVFLGVAALLGADDDDTVVAEPGKAANHGAVIGILAVAVQFREIGKGLVDVIQRIGTAGVAGELHALPGSEIVKNLAPGFLDFLFDELELFLNTDAEGMFFRVLPEVIQLGLQFEDGLFKIELMFHTAGILINWGWQATCNSTTKPGCHSI